MGSFRHPQAGRRVEEVDLLLVARKCDHVAATQVVVGGKLCDKAQALERRSQVQVNLKMSPELFHQGDPAFEAQRSGGAVEAEILRAHTYYRVCSTVFAQAGEKACR